MADANTGYAIAYLAHRAPKLPVVIDTVEQALGAVEYAATTGDRSVVPAIDAVIARFDGADYAETTVATARMALLDVEVTRLLGEDRRGRAMAHDDAIRGRAFGDFADPVTNRTARAYADKPDFPVLSGPANTAMMILKARLFRLTKDEVFRLEARSLFSTVQAYAPANADEQAESAFATTLLFEVTGEDRYLAQTDSSFDAIANRRGPGFTNEACPGCAFHSLWALGYRRGLAGEAY